mgnify:FL=1
MALESWLRRRCHVRRRTARALAAASVLHLRSHPPKVCFPLSLEILLCPYVTPTNAGPGGSGTSERTNVVRHPRCSRCPRVIFVMLIRVLNAGGNTGRVNDRCAGARRKASPTPSDWPSALVSRRRSAPLSPAPSTRRPEPFSSYLLTTRFCHDYLDRSAANHDSDEASIPLRRVLGWRQQLRECRRASSSDQPAEKEAIPQALLLRDRKSVV